MTSGEVAEGPALEYATALHQGDIDAEGEPIIDPEQAFLGFIATQQTYPEIVEAYRQLAAVGGEFDEGSVDIVRSVELALASLRVTSGTLTSSELERAEQSLATTEGVVSRAQQHVADFSPYLLTQPSARQQEVASKNERWIINDVTLNLTPTRAQLLRVLASLRARDDSLFLSVNRLAIIVLGESSTANSKAILTAITQINKALEAEQLPPAIVTHKFNNKSTGCQLGDVTILNRYGVPLKVVPATNKIAERARVLARLAGEYPELVEKLSEGPVGGGVSYKAAVAIVAARLSIPDNVAKQLLDKLILAGSIHTSDFSNTLRVSTNPFDSETGAVISSQPEANAGLERHFNEQQSQALEPVLSMLTEAYQDSEGEQGLGKREIFSAAREARKTDLAMPLAPIWVATVEKLVDAGMVEQYSAGIKRQFKLTPDAYAQYQEHSPELIAQLTELSPVK